MAFFNKVLVANRGEIAVRVMRACHEMGIGTVGVYSEADRNAYHAKYADEACPIGPPPASMSYLSIEAILDAAEKTEAEAVHPGYGFLAENPVFAAECARHGLKFIGPSVRAIEVMGSKIEARKAMEGAGVPIVPGSKGAVTEESEAREIAERLGYPVLLKASAGGGGIGMRIIRSEKELLHTFEPTQAIANSAFGDPTLFIEKYLERPRHIEFQILADEKGKTIHVGERECSIQRRHQKLLEEMPSPVVDDTTRQRVGGIAVRAAESIDYANAGTVEFIFSEGEFYFLEMNTRLQVEHAITERTTGIDLVKAQIQIAAGEELGMEQEDVTIRGHAIECRINAEDPLNDFAPSPGKITKYRSPGGPGIRIDSGVRMGYTIPPYYDSMISKLIAWGRDREEAVQRMRRALSEYIIIGTTTNIPFHRAVMENPSFLKGNLSTHFVQEENLLTQIPAILEADRERAARLKEFFRDDRKVVAISTAIGSYLDHKKRAQGSPTEGGGEVD